uniref:Uncharacterized protein n=1 Tax=Oryctolagus cuniculus TaxID=9986 RepID=A0A5F9CLJ0_RABIT
MASVIPLKKKKLMDVKLGKLPSRKLMLYFTPKGTGPTFLRGYYQYYKPINVKKGSSVRRTWYWQLMCFSTTAFLMSSAASTTKRC